LDFLARAIVNIQRRELKELSLADLIGESGCALAISG
jgi:hypothetical protein